MNLHFYDQLEGERFQFSFCKHWIFPFGRILEFLLFVGIFIILPFVVETFFSFVFADFITRQVFLCMNYILVLFIIHRFFLWLLYFSMSFVIVTNLRIIVITKSSFVRSEKEVLDLFQIRDIQMHKSGFWANIIDFGDINLILSTQGKDTTILKNIPQPSVIQEKCNYVRHARVQERLQEKQGIQKTPLPQDSISSRKQEN